jgi:hypothetical protein
MNEERIQQIKDQLRQLMQQISEMGEEPPPEIQDLLLQVLEKSKQKIQKLREEENNQPPQGAPPTQPPLGGQTAPDLEVSNDARLLWILSGSQPQAFISYLRSFPTPATQSLLNDPNHLNATIEQLQRSIPQEAQPVVDGIPHADLQSSNIWGANYDPATGKMKVRFQGGSEYEYDGVPKNIFNAFIKGNASAKTKGKNPYGEWWPQKNPSMGAAMNQYIKAGGFTYRKLR